MNRDALVVGINQYPFLKDTPTSKAKHLKTPANDAEAIAQRLEEYGGFRVRRLPETIQEGQRQVTGATGALVQADTLEDAIIQLFNPVGESVPQTALLYFIGHGLRKNRGGVTEGFLATSDADPRKNQWGVSLRWLRELLQKSTVQQQIVWLDCCYSGELFNFAEADLGTAQGERTRFFIAAAREFEPAEEDIEGQHGVFSLALWEGLDPRRQPEGMVNNDRLIEYIAQTLKDVPQQPIWYNPNSEIILTGEREQIFISTPDGDCPYKGLRFFDVEDAGYFYGREALTQKLIERVQVGKGNFLAVLGVSGSGKSSVLRAGLIYQLQQERRLPGTEQWKIRIFTPGEQPLMSLATAFLDEEITDIERARQLKEAEEAIAQGATGLARLIRASKSPRTVLIVDQFEEVFTVCQSQTERQQFICNLLDALKQTGDKLCLILAMRDDFLGKCAAYRELADLIQANLVMVTPMNVQELRQAIIEPAKKLGRKVEENLISVILKDLGVEVEEQTREPEPGMLPLLSYTLEQLWQRQTLNWLKLDSYNQLGGTQKTLENLAEQVYKELSTEERRVADQIFIKLTQLGEGTPDTRKQVPQQDLVTQAQSAKLVQQVVQKLAQAKLIVTSEQRKGQKKVAVVDVAHEVLIRYWSRLRELLDNNREAIRTERKIQAAAEEWQDKSKTLELAYLLQGKKLSEAEDLLYKDIEIINLSSLAQEFIQVSKTERDKQQSTELRRRKRTLIGLIFALFMTTGFSINFGFLVWQLSDRLKVTEYLENLQTNINNSSVIEGTEDFTIKIIAVNDKTVWMAVYDSNRQDFRKDKGFGLWQYNLQTKNLTRYLQNTRITAILTEGEKIWVGVEKQGVIHGVSRNGNFKFNLIKEVSAETNVLSLARDKQGNLWVGTSQGIYRQSSGDWQYIKNAQFLCRNLLDYDSNFNVRKILIDKKNNILWIATAQGLIQWSISNKPQLTKCYINDIQKQSNFQIVSNNLTTLDFDFKESMLVIGSFDGDISLITKDFDDSITYPRLADTIQSLIILPNKLLLAATRQNYISLYDSLNNRWVNILIDQGKPEEVYNIVVGKDKHLWIGTKQGLYRSNLPVLK